MTNETDVAHFTKHTIPLMKALVNKKLKEGNPICVTDPTEYVISEYLLSLIINSWDDDKRHK